MTKMRLTASVILTAFLAYSCNNKSNEDLENSSLSKNDNLVGDTVLDTSSLPNDMSNVFLKAVMAFPEDSASLYNFYFESGVSDDEEKLNRQIERLRALTVTESIDRYNVVQRQLKPLLSKIVNANTISKSQADSLVILYSEYDYFSAEGLFSKLLKGDDKYNLVWQSFKVMTKESNKDTCFISALTTLDSQITTNVELAEAMPDFIVQAIQNNPKGFLEMYGARRPNLRSDFANYISVYDEPDKKLLSIYTDISEKSENENHKKLAREIVLKFTN
ncbi:MAG TPA: hypothetical protein VEW65_13755 [Chryseolinea sp.]|nr:hypothetical protein [Chryseolinea sp.]